MDYLTYPFNMNKIYSTTGMDNIDTRALSIKPLSSPRDWITYPYPIVYEYNSRGFRDKEWPTNLDDIVWCLGDSFTKGVGVPYEHTWPFILQTNSKKRCINLGIDGAANRLLLNIAKQIISEYNPKYMIIMWSYKHRRYKDPWKFIHYEEDEHNSKSVEEFRYCFNTVNDLLPNIYNTTVPVDVSDLTQLNNILHEYELLDFGRDGHHFDYLTAEPIVDSIIQHFNFKRYDNEL
tara:strand:+ start:929 stop:1630 length:702 start_codon:yes stop_codon:yes gene_type:complete